MTPKHFVQIQLAILTTFTTTLVYGNEQFTINRSLQWNDTSYAYYADDNIMHEALYFTGAAFDFKNNELPVWGEIIQVNTKGRAEIEILEPVYELIARQDLVKTGKKFASRNDMLKPEPLASFSSARGVQYMNVSFIPIRKNPTTGKYEKLVRFSLKINIIPEAVSGFRSDDTHNYAANSVLANGSWYKIGVKTTGVYKIDKAFLQSLGINTSTMNANFLGIFGNGGGMLPEPNSAANYDDLPENAIYRSGLDDGSFDDGDYILFYAKGPEAWTYNATAGAYQHSKHLYSDESYYFITPDKGTGKSILSQANDAEAESYTTSTYDYVFAFDNDKVNLVNSGRNWYDAQFDPYNNSREYSRFIPNADLSQVFFVRANLAAKSNTVNPTMQVSGSNVFLTETFGITPVSTEGNYADTVTLEGNFPLSSGTVNLTASFIGSGTDLGWVNYIEVAARAKLTYSNAQLLFRDIKGVAPGQYTKYMIDGPEDLIIWDVSDVNNIRKQAFGYTVSDGDSFTVPSDSLKEFAAFYPADAFTSDQITNAGIVYNQNLHGAETPDYIIIAHPGFLSEARRLAAWHHDVHEYDTMVVNIFQVYNEFSSGAQDITAIRNFMRMFYDRAAGIESEMPKYLLLFGDASYDYKNIISSAEDNTNFVPTYESFESDKQTETFPTDDYFVCLDSDEGYDMSLASHLLDVAVGRFPVKTTDEAADVVNKIMHYKSAETFGNWRNVMCFIADDEDNDTHIINANDIANYIDTSYPVYNLNKIYIDAYQQIPGAGGERYPDVNTALNNQIFTGALIMNWAGHGNEQNWAQERILSVDDINNWTNYDKLPLFITATCSFSRFDNPDKTSAGELILLNPQGGGVGLVSTVRIVYSNANYELNLALNSNLFVPLPDGKMPALGEALRRGKNSMEGTSAVNSRKFFLFGDPGLQLNYPMYNVKTTKINNEDISVADTLKALSKVTIEGIVTDMSGIQLTDFEGTVYPTVYDKPINITTLVNDPGSYAYTFKLQKNAIYKGKASVHDGAFSYTFVVPKDISYDFGNGKLSYYADNGTEDAAGYEMNVMVGGSADSINPDNEGPEISVFMNDETFVFGGLTDEDPVLYIKLEDENGMNTVGNGIGHDIMSTLDENQQSETKLNDYYEAELDNYQAGTVSYPLRDIATGRHSIRVSAWDVYDNPGEGYTEFVVAESADLALDHVLNYPNPFTTSTSFWFEHNRPGDILDVKVEIFTVSGKLVKTILQQVVTDGYRVSDIAWDGLDNYGDQIGKGVYVYKLSVKAESDRSKASEFQKLVILR